MSEHRHDQSRLVVHRTTYERHPFEAEEDAAVACASCIRELGLYVGEIWYPPEPEEGLEAEVVLEIVSWDASLYPYDASARPGEPRYRPDETWAPSLNEIYLARGDGR